MGSEWMCACGEAAGVALPRQAAGTPALLQHVQAVCVQPPPARPPAA